MSHQQILFGARVFDGDRFHDQAALVLDGGRIAELRPYQDGAEESDWQNLGGGVLAPGFIDLQVNGGGGRLFNNDPTVESLASIVTAHRRGGTTALLPTLISDAADVQRQGAAAVAAAIDAGMAGILGVHLEGPYIDAARRGVHQEHYFRDLDADEIDWIGRLAQRYAVMVTLAPERVAPAQIAALAASGVRVCAGHSNADFATVQAAIAAGLSGFTHLFNAMSPLGSREPGVVGAALLADTCYCGIIIDGHHVSAATAKIAQRVKAPGTLYLVSDSMATVGGGAADFELYGDRVSEQDGRLENAEGKLAGSAILLIDAVRIAHRELGLDLGECLRMASLYPANFIGESGQRGRLAPGYRADLVHFGDDFAVRSSWCGGERVINDQSNREVTAS